jgi:hypothetical protein
MSREEREREFFQRLLELCNLYGVSLDSCGCCESTWANFENGGSFFNLRVVERSLTVKGRTQDLNLT